MLTRLIAFCEQTHAQGQGYAADDHISKECYTIPVTPEEEAEITKLVNELAFYDTRDQQAAINEWWQNNVNETECTMEGEEFVGLTWIETHPATEGISHDYQDTQTVLKRLRSTLKEKEATRGW